MLGLDAADIVSSGDEVADKSDRDRVIEAYDAKHQVVMEGADKAVLVLGNQDWPFPILLVRKDGTWRFDTVAGREEILFRRIGRNELAAIQTILAFVDAQQEYAEKGIGGNGVYAQRTSRPGTKDGLYWPAQSGEEESPLGDLAASAARRLSRRSAAHSISRLLLQGSHQAGTEAPGGALDYIVRGKMIGGFALVAYPAQYGNSGVMTFLVNHQGTIYEKDLESARHRPRHDGVQSGRYLAAGVRSRPGQRSAVNRSALSEARSTLPAMSVSIRVFGG